MAQIEAELLRHLACPRDHLPLREEGSDLCCSGGHRYPIIEGVPVLLVEERAATLGVLTASLNAAKTGVGSPLYLETLGLSDEQRRTVAKVWETKPSIDPVVSHLIGATSGNAYLSVLGNVAEYPVPDIRLPAGQGRLLLDVGCSWGRWTISGARKGWKVIGIDPSLGALLAARRAFLREGKPTYFVCGDARALPFRSDSIDQVYSYSVLQHFSREDLELSLGEIGRVLRPGGESKVQMAAKWGLRSLYVQTRPGYAASGGFRVRYWSIPELKSFFSQLIGSTKVQAEAYGGLGLLSEDARLLGPRARLLLRVSTTFRRIAKVVPVLVHVADSVFVTSKKQQTSVGS